MRLIHLPCLSFPGRFDEPSFSLSGRVRLGEHSASSQLLAAVNFEKDNVGSREFVRLASRLRGPTLG